jgi:hypothetical protein
MPKADDIFWIVLGTLFVCLCFVVVVSLAQSLRLDMIEKEQRITKVCKNV